MLVQHNSDSYIAGDFVAELLAVDKAHGNIVAEINIVAQDVSVDQLPNVFLSVIRREPSLEELLPYLRHLLLDNFFLLGLA